MDGQPSKVGKARSCLPSQPRQSPPSRSRHSSRVASRFGVLSVPLLAVAGHRARTRALERGPSVLRGQRTALTGRFHVWVAEPPSGRGKELL